jgi:Flp pilus assembly pilin Flp
VLLTACIFSHSRDLRHSTKVSEPPFASVIRASCGANGTPSGPGDSSNHPQVTAVNGTPERAIAGLCPRAHSDARRQQVPKDCRRERPPSCSTQIPKGQEGENVTKLLHRLWSEEEGQDIAEYAVMLAVILVIVVGTVRLIGGNANNVFSSVSSSIGS